MTSQGVPDDYENAWQQARLYAGRMRMQLAKDAPSPVTIAQIQQGLNTPIQTLAEYCEQFYPPAFRESIAPHLHTQTVEALDALTAGYNTVAGQGTMTHALAQEFAEKAHRIIHGQTK